MKRGIAGGLSALALAGCGVTGAGATAGPPSGGWPQPSGSQVTADMCGLLTDADYDKAGHDRRAKISGTVDGQANSLGCRYRSGDAMTLSLQPTADFAEYEFAAGLTDHRRRLAGSHRRSGLVSGVVGAADESWFDDSAPGTAGPVAHELRLRRGSLILGITLGGVRGKGEKDPRGVLVGLAGLVLQRLPHVGAKDTGTAHKIQYEVIGTGTAASISWEDYTGIQGGGRLANTRLPWLHAIPVGAADGVQPATPTLHVEASSPTAKIACVILSDGVPVAARRSTGVVDCRGEVPDSGGSRAQPASLRTRPYDARRGEMSSSGSPGPSQARRH
jgi:hypothetical protein